MDERSMRENDTQGQKGKPGKSKRKGIILYLLFIGVMPFLLTALRTDNKTAVADHSWVSKDASFGAFYYTKEAVRKTLKAPSTARFAESLRDETSVNREGQVYTVVSWVDAQNSFGAMLRKVYVAKIEQVSDGVWQLKEVTFLK